jgi:plasmid replication initiation protein
MKKFLAVFFGGLAKRFGAEEITKDSYLCHKETNPIQVQNERPKKEAKTPKKIKKQKKKQYHGKKSSNRLTDGVIRFDPRDIMETMKAPFLSLSKNRINPILYEKNGEIVKISAHRGQYIASIYDWDIIECIAGKIQEMFNSGEDIPPRTLIIPRRKLIKSLYKHDGKTTDKEIEASLSRLKSTLIETTVLNKDGRYKGEFGFLDSWEYTERKDIKEFRITLSKWLYDVICKKRTLLKVAPEYFKLTSGLKKALYRIARKHAGTKNDNWILSLQYIYEKSGSEQDFKKFKYDLKKAVSDNDIPTYLIEWVEDEHKTYVRFINKEKYLKKMLKSGH